MDRVIGGLKVSKKLPKVVYDKESDSLYMIISKGKQEGYIELAPNVNLEIGMEGKIIGLEILQASKILRRGSMVIPSRERRKAKIKEGDRVEIRAEGDGLLRIKKVASLKDVQEKMAGRLPQWSRLEGKADKLLEREVKS